MTSSGTYAYNPSLGELTLYAFNLCGIRSTELEQAHFESARMAANMLLSRWSNQGVNLWAVSQVTTALVQGTTTYTVDPSVVMVLDAYITTGTTGTTTEIDRIIMPISRTEYASYPNKQQQGFPTTYWFDRLLSPTITLWPVPDGSETSLVYYCVKQLQDAAFTSGQTLNIPYLWLEAFAYGLAQRLATIWAPTMAIGLKPLADESYQIAADQNTEYVQVYISPMVSGYFS